MAYTPNNPNGQATMANSAPVVIASDQSSIPVNDNGGSITVDGTVAVSNFPATQPISGTVTVQQAVAANLNATVVGSVSATQSGTWNINDISGTISLPTGAATETTLSAVNTKIPSGLTVTSTRLLVDGSGVTQPISGTVAATQSGSWSVGLNAGTNYVGRVRLTDGTTDAEVIPLTNYNAQAVAIVDGSGNQVTSFGGGTQYADGTAVATPTGTVSLGFDGTNVQALSTTAAGLLNIADGGGSITIDGTVAATQSGSWSVTNLANSGVDIGDVTINNAAGASAVNIQDGGNSITVDGTVAATQSGTWNIGTLTSITNTVTVSGTVTASNTSGDVAHDSPDSGNPVKIGFQAETALPTAVANGDRSNGISDRYGRQLISHIDPGMQIWKSGEYTSTQTGTNIWVPTAGNRFVITQINIATGGTTAGLVTIWGAQTATTVYAAGTDQVFFRGTLTPTANATPGALIQPPYPMFSDTLNDCLKITTSANMTIYIQVYGYEIIP